MLGERATGLDWRAADAYAPLLDADRALFAWEWLRRGPSYRLAARAFSDRETSNADEFGLVAFEPPELGVPLARPIWRSDVHPYVLTVGSFRSARYADSFDLRPMAKISRMVATQDAEHLLLSDGLRSIRIDAPHGAFCKAPACLAYSLEGLASAEAPLLTLARFLALCRTGGFSRVLHRREVRARRWILMLRAWDAQLAGADQREIARVLLSRSAGAPGWRSREPSVRSRAQRLVRSARSMAGGGYRLLLR